MPDLVQQSRHGISWPYGIRDCDSMADPSDGHGSMRGTPRLSRMHPDRAVGGRRGNEDRATVVTSVPD